MAQPGKWKLVQRRLGLSIGLAGLTAPACTNDLDSLFCDPESEDCGAAGSGAEEDDGAPILPFLPDEDAIEECETCSAVTCKEERDECLKDDLCTAQLRCLGECSDPGCREACRGSVGSDGLDVMPFSPRYHDLSSCTFDRCAVECQAGENWECVGNYIWPPVETSSIEAYVRFGTGEGGWTSASLAGATVKACFDVDDDGGCDSPDVVQLDAAQGAHLSFEGRFDGYFELVPARPSILTMNDRIYPLPRSYGGTMEPSLFSPYILRNLGVLPTPQTATIQVLKMDCTLSISESAGQMVAFEQWGTERVGETGEHAREPVVIFPNIPLLEEQMVTVQFTLSGEEERSEWRDVLISPGWTTSVTLAPRPHGR